MTLAATAAITIAAGMTVQARAANENRVTVYVQNKAAVPLAVTNRAQVLASSMFASVGVRIDWRKGQPAASGQALILELRDDTPAAERPGALAYTKPFEGIHIAVFWDRIAHRRAPDPLLAHVMVHEITHLLEGVCRHSENGVMKAQWTEDDIIMMPTRQLTFAAEDVDLIHIGMARRYSSPSVELAGNWTPWR
jgi:hypothetical protein